MGHAKRHLRLVEPDERAPEPLPVPEWVMSRPPVDTVGGARFVCPTCGRTQETGPLVRQRWCVGGNLAGVPTHPTVEMVRTTLRS